MKTGYCLMTMCCLLAALSCTRQEIEPAPENQDALTLRITKADGTGVLVENLCVLIYDQDPAEGQEPVFYYESPADQTVDLSGITLIDGIWRNHFDGHDVCDVYVIANWNGDGTQQSPELGNTTTLEQLKDVLEYNSALISDATEGKFTMTGVQEGWKPAESPDVHTLLVPLERVAARIEVALYAQAAADGNWEDSDIIRVGKELSFEGADAGETKRVISAPQFRLINYATRSWLMDGRDSELDDRGLTSIADDAVVVADGVPFISYSYPNDWTSDLLDETYVLVNVPVKEGEDNYYKIPLRALSETQDLQRNHHYTVRAVISAKGNSTPDEPQLLENITYKVAPWEDVNMDVDPGNPVYLELSEYDVTITTSEAESSQKGYSTHGLIFASSSPISEVTVSEVYFYNQYGDRYNVNSGDDDYYEVENAYSENALNGPMTITSKDPLNKTVLYFTLTVKNEQGEERTVTVRHYPLEYITGVAGAYSYLNNEDYTGEWKSTWNILEYDNTSKAEEDEKYAINVEVPDYIRDGLNGNIGKGVDMKSKFYIKNERRVGRIFRIDENYKDQDKLGYENSDGLAYKVADNKSTGSNNMMYHVVVTSTSGDYVLARPIMDGGVVDPDRRDNDSFVSPSFMLASQLGNSSAVTWSTAQAQCRDYIEVAVDENGRETVYNDWRLPTAAEIGILIRYQSDDRVNTGSVDGVMSHILNYEEAPEDDRNSNPNYWVSSRNTYVEVHDTFDSNKHVKTTNSNSNEYRVRCVRDVYVSDNNQN
ncbi:MAG TPA: DUF1566 domain-containing protein [Candidatus Coprenecus merdigallinarum]|nr:DUF1566 domain-containing protein [Candidatus Coprenecus merdigallinarum]